MKKVLWRGLPIAIVVMAAIAFAGDKPWLDMEKCAFCRTLTEDPRLLENMTWEHHEISDGYLTVTMVEPEYHDSYIEAQKAMQKVGDELAQGKGGIYMCGHCRAYGNLMMSGADIEHVSTALGDIVLITSDKPEIIAMIKDYGNRSKEEMARLEQAEGDKD